MKNIILVVEDQEDFQTLLRLVLESEGYQVVVESTVEKAIEVLAEFRPTLIVTDLMMPGLSGLELIHHVKATSPLEDIPVIALTGGSKDLIEEARQLGAVEVMQKPVEIDELLQLIQGHAPNKPQTEKESQES